MPAWPSLHFGFCLLPSLRSGREFRLPLGFPFDAGNVLCSCFLLGIHVGQTVSRVGGPAKQLVETGYPATMINVGSEASMRLLLTSERPRAACRDNGLVFALESTAYSRKVGFELLPPSGRGWRFTAELRLMLSG